MLVLSRTGSVRLVRSSLEVVPPTGRVDEEGVSDTQAGQRTHAAGPGPAAAGGRGRCRRRDQCQPGDRAMIYQKRLSCGVCPPPARPLRLRAAAVPCLRVSPPPEGALPLLTPAARRARPCRCRSYLQPRTINEAKSRARVALHEVAVPCAVARANWLASAQGGPPCYCAQAPPRPVPVAARCLAA